LTAARSPKRLTRLARESIRAFMRVRRMQISLLFG
jgi:hypothetical protein